MVGVPLGFGFWICLLLESKECRSCGCALHTGGAEALIVRGVRQRHAQGAQEAPEARAHVRVPPEGGGIRARKRRATSSLVSPAGVKDTAHLSPPASNRSERASDLPLPLTVVRTRVSPLSVGSLLKMRAQHRIHRSQVVLVRGVSRALKNARFGDSVPGPYLADLAAR